MSRKLKRAAGARVEAARAGIAARKGAKAGKAESARGKRVVRARRDGGSLGQGDKGKAKAKKQVKPAGRSARALVEKVRAWTPEQPLPDHQHEGFARLMAQGVYSQTSCYLQVYEDVERSTARVNSSRLVLTNADVRARIEWLKRELVKDVKLTVEDSVRWCLAVRDTPVGYLDDESPLVQEVQRDHAGTEDAPVLKVKIKMPSKMDAQKQIDKLMGFDRDKDDPMAKAVDAMAEMVRMIREGRK